MVVEHVSILSLWPCRCRDVHRGLRTLVTIRQQGMLYAHFYATVDTDQA